MDHQFTEKQKNLLRALVPYLEEHKIGNQWLVIYDRGKFDHIKGFGELNTEWKELDVQKTDLDSLVNLGLLTQDSDNHYVADVSVITATVRNNFKSKRGSWRKMPIGARVAIIGVIVACVSPIAAVIVGNLLPHNNAIYSPFPQPTSTPIGWYDSFEQSQLSKDKWVRPEYFDCSYVVENGELIFSNEPDSNWSDCPLRLTQPQIDVPYKNLGRLLADFSVIKDVSYSSAGDRDQLFTFYLAFNVENAGFARCGFYFYTDGQYYPFIGVGTRLADGRPDPEKSVQNENVKGDAVSFTNGVTHKVELRTEPNGTRPFRCLVDDIEISYELSSLTPGKSEIIDGLKTQSFIRQVVFHPAPYSQAKIAVDNVYSIPPSGGN